MKKINLTLITLLCNYYAMCQQTAVSHVMNITLPAYLKIISKDEYLIYLKDSLNQRSFMDKDSDTFLKKDGILIKIKDNSINPDSRFNLETSRKQITSSLNHTGGVLESKTITVNNIPYAVIIDQFHDVRTLIFFSDFNKNNKRIHGVITYKTKDDTKAKEALQSLLQNMHFKEPIN